MTQVMFSPCLAQVNIQTTFKAVYKL